ncbi:DUF485 domain-containing protein [Arcobacter sp. FWKO B]|uniref:DUF485 domain-containing protein n=1 Tax=Arcobacter sp. FWKO B TaxID=2593672 RepID=UPI0018A429BF|nr:DUF485 domain-containing protein [Arcobacter sp. FWKO B]QOG11646.1 DUF485 domain-containing protein [Arcobacter sp. FWKO B]
MDVSTVEKIKNNPAYKELVSKRTSFSIKLSIVMLVAYYAFILVIAFNPSIFGESLSGGVTTIGIPIAIGIIFLAFILTGIYTKRANSEFDNLTNKIKEDLDKEQNNG